MVGLFSGASQLPDTICGYVGDAQKMLTESGAGAGGAEEEKKQPSEKKSD